MKIALRFNNGLVVDNISPQVADEETWEETMMRGIHDYCNDAGLELDDIVKVQVDI